MMDTPETSLLAKTQRWLANNGYPLELETGARLTNAGFQVSHSTYYVDERTRKAREMDVLAEIWTATESTPRVRISLVVECKQSSNKPWIVFASAPARQEKLFTSYNVPGEVAKTVIWELELVTNPDERLKAISTTGARGHGIVRANLGANRPDRFDRAYRALRSAASAATAAASKIDRDALKSDKLYELTLYLPVVVVDTTLFEFSLSSTGASELVDVARARVLVPTSRLDSSRIVVNVVTPRGLDDLVTDVKTDLAFLGEKLAPHWADLSIRVPNRFALFATRRAKTSDLGRRAIVRRSPSRPPSLS
jgi:hypothetical protein